VILQHCVENVTWIHNSQNGVHWQAILVMVKKLWVRHQQEITEHLNIYRTLREDPTPGNCLISKLIN